jgi:hypothetical protein
LLSSLAYIAAILAVALAGDAWPLAVYALSYWHYYLYWLAYYFGAVSLGDFKRDAVLMKSVSLISLGSAYLAAPPSPASLAAVAFGFLLNAAAAWALGPDRTYYGHEVAGLPPLRVTRFPYSWISHPMLVGNVVAFGGTLINTEFRRGWWPLACGHVVLNAGLLLMELYVEPRRRNARPSGSSTPPPARPSPLAALAGASLAVALSACAFRGAATLAGAGACAVAYASVLWWHYSSVRPTPGHQSTLLREASP